MKLLTELIRHPVHIISYDRETLFQHNKIHNRDTAASIFDNSIVITIYIKYIQIIQHI